MNIIDAICNLVNNPKTELKKISKSSSRANSLGDSFEEYIKDLFAQVTDTTTEEMRNELLQGTFSYLGNSNNPPDAMLWYGDAIEMKKLESENGSMPLNSSYPKHKVYSSDPMINQACKDAETWTEKDIIYAVGIFEKNTTKLKSLAFVYGEDYCASKSVYEKIKTIIKNGVETIPGIEFTESRELGHVNKVDPLGITYLRVRGMWGIENPFTVFNYIYKRKIENDFNFMCIINNQKYATFENTYELENLSKVNQNLKIQDVKIKNPDNPARLVEAKLITFGIEKNNGNKIEGN